MWAYIITNNDNTEVFGDAHACMYYTSTANTVKVTILIVQRQKALVIKR